MDYARARKHMVDSQVRPDNVTDRRLIHAMSDVARERFAPSDQATLVYSDTILKLADTRAMMAPRDFAKLVDAAEIGPGDAILDIACGLGYSTAVLARLGEAVVAVEADEALATKAEANLAAAGVDTAAVITGDLVKGAPDQGPFNVIIIEGAVEREPDALKAQLADGGRLLFVRRDGAVGKAVLVVRTGDRFGERTLFNSAAPLLAEYRREPEFVF